MQQTNSMESIKDLIQNNSMLVGYFSTSTCNVCKVLKPKIVNLLEEHFPQTRFMYVDLEKVPEAQGEFLVFAVPTIILFIDGKEVKRFSRHISVEDVRQAVERYYQILFE